MPRFLEYCFCDIHATLPLKAHRPVEVYTAFLKNTIGPVGVDEESIPRDKRKYPVCCNENGDMGIFTPCEKNCDRDPRYSIAPGPPGDGPNRDAWMKSGAIHELDLPKVLHPPPRPYDRDPADEPKPPAHRYLTIWKMQELGMGQEKYTHSWAADNVIAQRYPSNLGEYQEPLIGKSLYGKVKEDHGPPPPPRAPEGVVSVNTEFLQIDNFL